MTTFFFDGARQAPSAMLRAISTGATLRVSSRHDGFDGSVGAVQLRGRKDSRGLTSASFSWTQQLLALLSGASRFRASGSRCDLHTVAMSGIAFAYPSDRSEDGNIQRLSEMAMVKSINRCTGLARTSAGSHLASALDAVRPSLAGQSTSSGGSLGSTADDLRR